MLLFLLLTTSLKYWGSPVRASAWHLQFKCLSHSPSPTPMSVFRFGVHVLAVNYCAHKCTVNCMHRCCTQHCALAQCHTCNHEQCHAWQMDLRQHVRVWVGSFSPHCGAAGEHSGLPTFSAVVVEVTGGACCARRGNVCPTPAKGSQWPS